MNKFSEDGSPFALWSDEIFEEKKKIFKIIVERH